MNTFHYVLFAISATLYVSTIVFFLLTAGTRCFYCNRLIKGEPRHEHFGALVCDVCWEHLREDKPL